MGNALASWIRERAAVGSQTISIDVELRLAQLLAELEQRDLRGRRTRAVASGGGPAAPLRATDVVPDELVKDLRDERREAESIYVPYLRKAAKTEPVVEMMEVQIGTQHYNMPRIVLPHAASLEELEAMNAQYVSYGMLGGRKRLLEKQAKALAAVGGMNRDRFIVDGSGFGAMVYVHDAFSDAGLRGKRVLLLLDAEMGIDNGYFKKCFGSAEADGERARHDLKSQCKVRAAVAV